MIDHKQAYDEGSLSVDALLMKMKRWPGNVVLSLPCRLSGGGVHVHVYLASVISRLACGKESQDTCQHMHVESCTDTSWF